MAFRKEDVEIKNWKEFGNYYHGAIIPIQREIINHIDNEHSVVMLNSILRMMKNLQVGTNDVHTEEKSHD